MFINIYISHEIYRYVYIYTYINLLRGTVGKQSHQYITRKTLPLPILPILLPLSCPSVPGGKGTNCKLLQATGLGLDHPRERKAHPFLSFNWSGRYTERIMPIGPDS